MSTYEALSNDKVHTFLNDRVKEAKDDNRSHMLDETVQAEPRTDMKIANAKARMQK